MKEKKKRGACGNSKRKYILTGKRFGRLLVGAPDDARKNGSWLATCDCGRVISVRTHALRSGVQVSCGCWRNEQAAINSRVGAAKATAKRTRHGCATDRGRTSTYKIWEGIIQRCTNPRARTWRWYGALGVSICERWRKFENFLADMGERPDGLTIDRVNPFGNYEPGNCRWATMKEQSRNKRSTYAQR